MGKLLTRELYYRVVTNGKPRVERTIVDAAKAEDFIRAKQIELRGSELKEAKEFNREPVRIDVHEINRVTYATEKGWKNVEQ